RITLTLHPMLLLRWRILTSPLWMLARSVAASSNWRSGDTLVIEYSKRLGTPPDVLSFDSREALESVAATLGHGSEISVAPLDEPAQHTFLKSRPIALLRHRPTWRYQVLGSVEDVRRARWSAWAGLQLRAAILEADAVVEVQEEMRTHPISNDWR